MLSSAATSQFENPISANGLRSGAQEDAMMSNILAPSPGAWINELDPAKDKSLNGIFFESPQKEMPSISHQNSIGSGSNSRPSTQSGSSQSPFNFNSAPSPAGPSVLSPNGIFNFSPGLTGPIAWPPASSFTDGKMNAAMSNDGPWRRIETIQTVFEGSNVTDQDRVAAAELKGGLGQPDGMAPMIFDHPINFDNVEANPFQIDDDVQQQLFMDLFWPGWPANLPEPPVVNEL
jgi:hypothetical protein